MYWTRSRDRQAAEALIQLSQSPVGLKRSQCPAGIQCSQSPVGLKRSLSHQHEAFLQALTLFPTTQPGDTILMNFFINLNRYATVQYMKNEGGYARVHRMEGPYDDIRIPWTFSVTNFPF